MMLLLAPAARAQEVTLWHSYRGAEQQALDTVLDAARRDGAQWTRQLQSRWKRISIDARAAWQTLRRDPTNTLDGWLQRTGLPDSRTLALPLAGALTVLLLFLELLRGRGDLRVSIEYDGPRLPSSLVSTENRASLSTAALTMLSRVWLGAVSSSRSGCRPQGMNRTSSRDKPSSSSRAVRK